MPPPRPPYNCSNLCSNLTDSCLTHANDATCPRRVHLCTMVSPPTGVVHTSWKRARFSFVVEARKHATCVSPPFASVRRCAPRAMRRSGHARVLGTRAVSACIGSFRQPGRRPRAWPCRRETTCTSGKTWAGTTACFSRVRVRRPVQIRVRTHVNTQACTPARTKHRDAHADIDTCKLHRCHMQGRGSIDLGGTAEHTRPALLAFAPARKQSNKRKPHTKC
jgi:hypothetical protein